MDWVKAGLLTQSPKVNLVESWSQVALQTQRAFLTRQTASPSIPSTEINSRVFPCHRLGKHSLNCLPDASRGNTRYFLAKYFSTLAIQETLQMQYI